MHAVSAIPSWHALELDGPGKVAVQMRPEVLFSALGTEVFDFSALPPRSTGKARLFFFQSYIIVLKGKLVLGV